MARDISKQGAIFRPRQGNLTTLLLNATGEDVTDPNQINQLGQTAYLDERRWPVQAYKPLQDPFAIQEDMTRNLIEDRAINLGDRDLPYSYLETAIMQWPSIPRPGGPQGTGYRVPIAGTQDLLAELYAKRLPMKPPAGIGGAGG